MKCTLSQKYNHGSRNIALDKLYVSTVVTVMKI